jgi:hypothetical protein
MRLEDKKAKEKVFVWTQSRSTTSESGNPNNLNDFFFIHMGGHALLAESYNSGSMKFVGRKISSSTPANGHLFGAL